MEFNYNFDGLFVYEVDVETLRNAVLYLFSKNYNIDIKLVKLLYNDDWLEWEQLIEQFEEELREHFKEKAYKEYLDRRYT